MPKSGLYLSSEADTRDLWLPRRDFLQREFGSSILARWRAEDLLATYADGADVTEWIDYTGNGNNLVPVTDAPLFQTDLGPNGYPRVEYELGSTQDLQMSDAPLCT